MITYLISSSNLTYLILKKKFDVNWLLRFSNEFLEELSNIDVVKAGIRNKFKNEMIEKDLDKRLKEIYFTHFS